MSRRSRLQPAAQKTPSHHTPRHPAPRRAPAQPSTSHARTSGTSQLLPRPQHTNTSPNEHATHPRTPPPTQPSKTTKCFPLGGVSLTLGVTSFHVADRARTGADVLRR